MHSTRAGCFIFLKRFRFWCFGFSGYKCIGDGAGCGFLRESNRVRYCVSAFRFIWQFSLCLCVSAFRFILQFCLWLFIFHCSIMHRDSRCNIFVIAHLFVFLRSDYIMRWAAMAFWNFHKTVDFADRKNHLKFFFLRTKFECTPRLGKKVTRP